jgi:hypothetical protein
MHYRQMALGCIRSLSEALINHTTAIPTGAL